MAFVARRAIRTELSYFSIKKKEEEEEVEFSNWVKNLLATRAGPQCQPCEPLSTVCAAVNPVKTA
jgi:hypothetical protein